MIRTPLTFLLALLLLTLVGCGQSGEQPAGAPSDEAPAGMETQPAETPAAESPAAPDTQPPADSGSQPRLITPGYSPDVSQCVEPRPEMCTQDYTPVCGVHNDGSRQTYSNGCTGCANPDVVGVIPGPCPE